MLFDPKEILFLSKCFSNVLPHNAPVSIINMSVSLKDLAGAEIIIIGCNVSRDGQARLETVVVVFNKC